MNTNNLLLGILIIAVFAVGVMIGRFSAVGDSYTPNPSPQDATSARLSSESADGTEEQTTASVENEGGTTINANALTEGQRKMLGALGIDANSITITPAMIACAEAELGATRMDEIANGATPSFGEGMKLVAC